MVFKKTQKYEKEIRNGPNKKDQSTFNFRKGEISFGRSRTLPFEGRIKMVPEFEIFWEPFLCQKWRRDLSKMGGSERT